MHEIYVGHGPSPHAGTVLLWFLMQCIGRGNAAENVRSGLSYLSIVRPKVCRELFVAQANARAIASTPEVGCSQTQLIGTCSALFSNCCVTDG